MLVGDKIKVAPSQGDRAGEPVTATVVYIHPKWRSTGGRTVIPCGRPFLSATGRGSD